MLVKESGISFHRTLSYLESISTAYVLIPHDRKSIMKMILTATQFAVWLTDYQELCMTQAEVLHDRNPAIVAAQLTRECFHSPYSAGRQATHMMCMISSLA